VRAAQTFRGIDAGGSPPRHRAGHVRSGDLPHLVAAPLRVDQVGRTRSRWEATRPASPGGPPSGPTGCFLWRNISMHNGSGARPLEWPAERARDWAGRRSGPHRVRTESARRSFQIGEHQPLPALFVLLSSLCVAIGAGRLGGPNHFRGDAQRSEALLMPATGRALSTRLRHRHRGTLLPAENTTSGRDAPPIRHDRPLVYMASECQLNPRGRRGHSGALGTHDGWRQWPDNCRWDV
jgi:hypothetical protein